MEPYYDRTFTLHQICQSEPYIHDELCIEYHAALDSLHHQYVEYEDKESFLGVSEESFSLSFILTGIVVSMIAFIIWKTKKTSSKKLKKSKRKPPQIPLTSKTNQTTPNQKYWKSDCIKLIITNETQTRNQIYEIHKTKASLHQLLLDEINTRKALERNYRNCLMDRYVSTSIISHRLIAATYISQHSRMISILAEEYRVRSKLWRSFQNRLSNALDLLSKFPKQINQLVEEENEARNLVSDTQEIGRMEVLENVEAIMRKSIEFNAQKDWEIMVMFRKEIRQRRSIASTAEHEKAIMHSSWLKIQRNMSGTKSWSEQVVLCSPGSEPVKVFVTPALSSNHTCDVNMDYFGNNQLYSTPQLDETTIFNNIYPNMQYDANHHYYQQAHPQSYEWDPHYWPMYQEATSEHWADPRTTHIDGTNYYWDDSSDSNDCHHSTTTTEDDKSWTNEKSSPQQTSQPTILHTSDKSNATFTNDPYRILLNTESSGTSCETQSSTMSDHHQQLRLQRRIINSLQQQIEVLKQQIDHTSSNYYKAGEPSSIPLCMQQFYNYNNYNYNYWYPNYMISDPNEQDIKT